MFIFGDFTTNKARQLNIQLTKCRGRPDCKTDREIAAFFRGKYIMLLANSVRFMAEGFGPDAIVKESRLLWLTINTKFTNTLPYKLSTYELELQDKAFNLDGLTSEEKDNVFKLEPLTPFSYEKDFDTSMDITIERNLNKNMIARSGYTILDWISDIGGIQGILISAVAIVVSYWNYNYLENFMVSKLFRIEKKDAGNEVYDDPDDKYDNFRLSALSGLRDVLCDSLPSCFQCCRNSRNDRGLALGRAKLEKESNIITILQSRRYFNAALKQLLTKKQRQTLKD